MPSTPPSSGHRRARRPRWSTRSSATHTGPSPRSRLPEFAELNPAAAYPTVSVISVFAAVLPGSAGAGAEHRQVAVHRALPGGAQRAGGLGQGRAGAAAGRIPDHQRGVPLELGRGTSPAMSMGWPGSRCTRRSCSTVVSGAVGLPVLEQHQHRLAGSRLGRRKPPPRSPPPLPPPRQPPPRPGRPPASPAVPAASHRPQPGRDQAARAPPHPPAGPRPGAGGVPAASSSRYPGRPSPAHPRSVISGDPFRARAGAAIRLRTAAPRHIRQ